MEMEKKVCSCEKLKQLSKKNSDLKKNIVELLEKIEKLEKFIKGENI